MSKTICLLVLTVAALAVAAKFPKWHELEGYTFEQYIADHNKVYSAEELLARKAAFENRLATVRAHNANPGFSWKRGINHMSDWTHEEKNSMKGYDKNIGHAMRTKRAKVVSNVPNKQEDSENATLPQYVDWRDLGVVTPVKDQGQCGSCWTFATAETAESHYAIATGHLGELSEQHVLDCVPNPLQCGGQGGCSGGTVELAYSNLLLPGTGGMVSEWTYPYRSYFGDAFQCSFNRSRTAVFANITGYVTLPTNKYKPLMIAVATLGPIAISVDASAWHDYESGVFNGCNQTNPDIDHAVQLVGYGTDEKLGDYWLVRNSWGPKWGEKGYIRIYRSDSEEGRCGEDITPRDGEGCADGPPQVEVCGTCGILFDSVYPTVSK
ncbi:hypothetical protein PROFUN_10420 [Planoprotostelium fungivorum]|uniref:Uncharacterized protein n=1 Tax=Planoprotostelium fungivorum TaxID=1890364 RepID=A0A2P6NE53_9EUKA|nr:hypothetical protein PROFUN_10420 [Planoprotostelium fungivorum]